MPIAEFFLLWFGVVKWPQSGTQTLDVKNFRPCYKTNDNPKVC